MLEDRVIGGNPSPLLHEVARKTNSVHERIVSEVLRGILSVRVMAEECMKYGQHDRSS